MSKKVNFSLTDREYSKLEAIAKKRNKKVIEIIRERYELGSNFKTYLKKIVEIEKLISGLRDEQNDRFLKVLATFEFIVKQNVFSTEVLDSILKGNIKGDDLSKILLKIDEKIKESISEVRQIYYEDLIKNGS